MFQKALLMIRFKEKHGLQNPPGVGGGAKPLVAHSLNVFIEVCIKLP